MVPVRLFFFFFNDTATTEIYTLSLHDALPISHRSWSRVRLQRRGQLLTRADLELVVDVAQVVRSEEHTSELQSLAYLVCRLLLEKKKKMTNTSPHWSRQPTQIPYPQDAFSRPE